MLWVPFSFLTAIFESAKDIVSKKNLANHDPYLIAWALRVYSLPILVPLVFLFPLPNIDNSFWYALLAGGALNVVSTILYMRALKSSDLSLVAPLIAFTPLFLLISSPLILNEMPTIWGAVGVLLIVVGSYILYFNRNNKGFLSPFKEIIKSKGSRYMLTVSLIWAITSTFDKIGVNSSGPLFWAASANAFIALAMTPLIILRLRKKSVNIYTEASRLIPIGVFGAATLAFQMVAIGLTNVAYVISIKRTSIAWSVLAGYFVFKEKNIKVRLLGAAVMIAGVVLIILGGLKG
jgi:drug/metabolite transporter (DMT)-like permease